jgi:hypothetical protein
MVKENAQVSVRDHVIQPTWSTQNGQLHISKDVIAVKDSTGDDVFSWQKKKVTIKTSIWTNYITITQTDGKRFMLSTYTQRESLFFTTPLIIIFVILLGVFNSNENQIALAYLWMIGALILLGSYIFHYIKYANICKKLQHYHYMAAR